MEARAKYREEHKCERDEDRKLQIEKHRKLYNRLQVTAAM